ncbi:MAG TPA: hypothetical protein PLY21_17190 [Spirochaetota bacterium]|nr:hypothetical protein [Spirochaetota bacterium]
MKKNRHITLFIFLAVILVITGINEAFDLVQCNMRRSYKSMEDRDIQRIKDKIAGLEKEQIKDVSTVKRLADQYALLGRIFLERKMWDQSIECYLNSEKYGGNGAAVMYALGLGYANRGYEHDSDTDFAKAEEYYRKSLEKKAGYDDALYGLGVLMYYHRNGKEEGLRLVTELAMKNPAYYPARFAMGRFNYENGDLHKALQIYQQLQQDLDRLPKSEIINNYKEQCSANIARITTELSVR